MTFHTNFTPHPHQFHGGCEMVNRRTARGISHLSRISRMFFGPGSCAGARARTQGYSLSRECVKSVKSVNCLPPSRDYGFHTWRFCREIGCEMGGEPR